MSECPTALAIAMASSQLECDFGISYMMHDEGNADRGTSETRGRKGRVRLGRVEGVGSTGVCVVASTC